MTAAWSKGHNARYPYYSCQAHGCPSFRKSVRAERLEGEFEALLAELRPSEELFRMASAMFRQLWRHRAEARRGESQSAEVAACEARIRELGRRKAELSERIAGCGRPLPDFDRSCRTAETTLPFKLLSDLRRRKTGMVDLDGAVANRLFEELAQWNAVLERVPSLKAPQP